MRDRRLVVSSLLHLHVNFDWCDEIKLQSSAMQVAQYKRAPMSWAVLHSTVGS